MSSIVVLQKSETPAGVGFSIWMREVRDEENQDDKKVDVLSLNQGKPEPKKRLCMCSPTNHPGSFRCRYHRATAAQKVKVEDPAATVARHLLNSMNGTSVGAGVKPQLSRFSKAGAAVASELSR